MRGKMPPSIEGRKERMSVNWNLLPCAGITLIRSSGIISDWPWPNTPGTLKLLSPVYGEKS